MQRSRGAQPLGLKLRCRADTTNHYRNRGIGTVMDDVRVSAMKFVVYYCGRIITRCDNRNSEKLYDHTTGVVFNTNLFIYMFLFYDDQL